MSNSDRIPGSDDDDISPPTWLPNLLRMDRERAEMEARDAKAVESSREQKQTT